VQELVFLSAQPDDYFFVWQLELQLYNFSGLGIPPEQIHILVGYHPGRGLRHYFVDFIEKYKHKARFFPYPDHREQPKYTSSLRPHIIHQHFTQNPWLQTKTLFYHDSDIIFRALPDFTTLLQDEFWYVSDTRSYLDSSYILGNADKNTFHRMCSQVGIDPDYVIANDENCGGAQYLLKGTNASFWKKLETDSEAIYRLLIEDNLRRGDKFLREGKNFSDYNGIQSWCADMWACFYNLLYHDKKVKISTELNFCWASQSISDWHRTKILHYTGLVQDSRGAFDKTKYIHYPPYYEHDVLKKIDEKSATYPLVQLIDAFLKDQAIHKIDLTDVSFLIPVRIDSPSRMKNLQIVTSFLAKYFNTNILLLEADDSPKVSLHSLPSVCEYFFQQDDNPLLHRTRMNNFLIMAATTPIVVLYDTDVVLSIEQILSSTMLLRTGQADATSPYDGRFTSVDVLFKMLFEKILDPELLLRNMEMHNTSIDRSWGGCLFVQKIAYIQAGMENEFFKSWGPEDRERIKRLKGLEYTIKRIDGPLFHLPHERKENSSFPSTEIRTSYFEEYLKICDLHKTDLESYISTWQWADLHKTKHYDCIS
jgi:hypothetical protein